VIELARIIAVAIRGQADGELGRNRQPECDPAVVVVGDAENHRFLQRGITVVMDPACGTGLGRLRAWPALERGVCYAGPIGFGSSEGLPGCPALN
jgi:hypothetical protein